jgi:hypothetical protein
MKDLKALCKANGITIIRQRAKYVEAKRKDGLVIFLDNVSGDDADKDILTVLNYIRMTAKPQDVIMAVGMVRGVQVARNYAERHLPGSVPEIMNIMKSMLKGNGYRKRIRKLKALEEK